MICQLCNQEKKLINAHIIPRSFFSDLTEEGRAPIVIDDKAGSYPKRTPIGIYDSEILCEDCERLFSIWDDYGRQFLSQDIDEDKYVLSNGERLACNFGAYDYARLKMFFLSVLWRASVSKNKFFYQVQLGPYQERLKEIVLSGDPGGRDDFAVALSKFDKEANETGYLNPNRVDWEGVNHYRLYINSYMAIIKVTNMKPPSSLHGLYFEKNRGLVCIVREFEKSKEYLAMVHTAKNSRKPVKS